MLRKYIFSILFLVSQATTWGQSSFYVSSFCGINYADIPTTVYPDGDIEILTKTGLYIGGSVGYKFVGLLKLEEEVSLRQNENEKLILSSHSESLHLNLTGVTNRYSLMTNALIDIPSILIHPYIGVGIGYTYDERNIETEPFESNGQIVIAIDHYKSYGCAYQGIIGLSFQPISKINIRADYRYVGWNSERDRSNSFAFSILQSF